MCLFLSVSFSAPHSSELLQCESCYSCSGCLCCGKTAGTGFDHHSWLRSACKGWVRFLFLLNVVCSCSRIWELGIKPNSLVPSISELAEVYCKRLLISCMLVRYFQLVLCRGLTALVHFIYDIFYLPHWSMEHLRQVHRERLRQLAQPRLQKPVLSLYNELIRTLSWQQHSCLSTNNQKMFIEMGR